MASLRFSAAHLIRWHRQLACTLTLRNQPQITKMVQGQHLFGQKMAFHSSLFRSEKVFPSTIGSAKNGDDMTTDNRFEYDSRSASKISQVNPLGTEGNIPGSESGQSITEYSEEDRHSIQDVGLGPWRNSAFDPDPDVLVRVGEFVKNRTGQEVSAREMHQLKFDADHLALSALRIREESLLDPGEHKAKQFHHKKIFFHIRDDFPKKDAFTDDNNGASFVTNYCSEVLKVENVDVEQVFRGNDGRYAAVTFTDKSMVEKVMDAFFNIRPQGLHLVRARPIMERKYRWYQRLERKTRNKLYYLQDLPLTYGHQRVWGLPRLMFKFKEDLGAMEILADEHRAWAARLRELVRDDVYETEARMKLTRNLNLWNVPTNTPDGYRDPEKDEEIVRAIFKVLNADFSRVEKIEPAVALAKTSCLRIVVPHFETRQHLLAQASFIKQLFADDPSLNRLRVSKDFTHIENYMLKNLKEELRLRMTISNRKGENCFWIIKRMKVTRQIISDNNRESYGQHSFL